MIRNNDLKMWHRDFLMWLVSKFGAKVRFMSYRDLAREYGASYETIRQYVRVLEINGYLRVHYVSERRFEIHINEFKSNSLLK